jgi:hypothetical protein
MMVWLVPSVICRSGMPGEEKNTPGMIPFWYTAPALIPRYEV